MGDDDEVTTLKDLLAKAHKAKGDEFMVVYKFGKIRAQATPAENDPKHPAVDFSEGDAVDGRDPVQSDSLYRSLLFLPVIALTWLLLSSKWNVSASIKIEISAKYEVTVNQADFPLLPSTAGLFPLPVPNQAECQVPCQFTQS